jgi:predicted transcriptional regulator
VEIADVVAFMSKHDLPNMPVTTSRGELVGLLLREEVVTRAAQARASA